MIKKMFSICITIGVLVFILVSNYLFSQPLNPEELVKAKRAESVRLNELYRSSLQGITPLAIAGSIQVNENATYAAYTPQQLVENIFAKGAGCLLVRNITFKGSGWNGTSWSGGVNNRSLSYFHKGTSNFPITEGLLLSTGNGKEAEGPNTQTGAMTGGLSVSGDPDLQSLVSENITSGAILELDFVPTTTTMEFKYIFASEEYPEFVNTGYNDVFGFFISKGSGAKTNIATLPTTNSGNYVVSINNVNNGHKSSNTNTTPGSNPKNSNYFISNIDGSLTTQLDGYTVVLTARYTNLVPCETYHLKLAVANAGDNAYGSAVFLQAQSFDAGANLEQVGNGISGMTNVFNGCTNNRLVFTRSNNTLVQTVQFSFSGTAINGVDFTTTTGTALPTSIVFPVGVSSVALDYIIPNNGKTYNGEWFKISMFCPCLGMNISAEKTVYFYNSSNILSVNSTPACSGSNNGTITVNTTGGSGTYEYALGSGAWTNNKVFANLAPGTYSVKTRDVGGCDIKTEVVTVSSLSQLDLQVTGNATCTGSKANLTASSTSFSTPIFQWYSDAALTNLVSTGALFTTPSITVNTTYYVKVSDANSPCTRSIPVVVTVSTPPVVNALSNLQFCNNQASSQITFSGTAGATYNWSNNNTAIGLSASGTGNILSFTAANLGQTLSFATITVTPVLNGCAGSPKTFTITVNPSPITPSISNASSTTFCAGGSVTLSTTSASSYQWYKNGVAIATNSTNQSLTVNSLQTDLSNTNTYTVKVKNSYGCESSFSNPITVTINALPTTNITILSGTSPFCEGSSMTLRSAMSGASASSYQWYKNGLAIGGAQSQNITVTTAGSYTVTVTNANGCVSPQSSAISIVVWPKPTATISGSKVVCETSGAESLDISFTGAQPWSFTYTDGDTPITINNVNTSPFTLSGLHPTSTKTYTITSVTDANNCSNSGIGSGTVYVQPCGFGEPMMIWLKANDGVEIAGANAEKWHDKSGSGAEDIPTTRQSGTISWIDNSINFNPAVIFNGLANHYMAGTVKEPFPGEYTAFAVSKKGPSNTPGIKGLFTTRNNVSGSIPGSTPGPGIIYQPNGINPYYALDGQLADNTNTANTLNMFPGSLILPSLISGVARLPAENTSNSIIYLNGNLSTNLFSSTPLRIDAKRFEVGGRSTEATSATAGFEGSIAEVIYFSTAFVSIDMDKAASYLGIKYGIALPHNYLASNALPVWSHTVNNGYNTEIAGIAKDLGFIFEQRISKNENPGNDMLIVANGKHFVTNQTQAKPITQDKSYFLWGHNKQPKTFSALVNNRYRFNRVWKAQMTGSGIDTLSLQFNIAGVTIPTPNNGTATLLISSDPNFSTIVSSKTISLSGTSLTYEGVIIANGHYFTLATTTGANILGTASLWLKADKNVTGNPTVSSWKDQTINADIYTAGNNPTLHLNVTNNINFNPLIRFSGNGGTKDFFTGRTSIKLAHTYVVGKFNSTGTQPLANSGAMIADQLNQGYLFRDMNIGSNIGFHDQSSNASLFNYVAKPQGINMLAYKSVPNGMQNSFVINGSKQALTGSTVVNAYSEKRNIGTQGNPISGYFQGDIAEIIGFSDTLNTENKRISIESYLGIKYGISLTSNYMASDYTVTWNQNQDPNFRTQIAGIGSDQAFGLNQTVSHNVQPGKDLITISHGTVFPSGLITAQSGASFVADKSFLIWANNNKPTSFTSTVSTLAGNKLYLLERKWLVQKTGTLLNISIEVDTTGTLMQFPAGSGACRKLVLLSSADASFTSPNILGTAEISSSGKAVFNDFLMDNTNPYFTLAVVEVKTATSTAEIKTCDVAANKIFNFTVTALSAGETGKLSLVSITGGNASEVLINDPDSPYTGITLPVQNTTTDVSAKFEWVVTNTLTGCQGSTVITITRFAKSPIPEKPVADPSYCQNTIAVPLQATVLPGYTLHWYSVVGGVHTFIGLVAPTPSTTIVGTETFAVTQKNDGTLCESEPALIDVITFPLPTAHMSISADAICLGEHKTITFDLTGTAPWNINLSDGTVMNGILLSPHVFNVTPVASGNTLYSVTSIQDANGCNNVGSSTVTVFVNPIIGIQQTDITIDTICPGEKVVIQINPTTIGATYNVYADALGTNLLQSELGTGGAITLVITNPTLFQKTTNVYLNVISLTGCHENRTVQTVVPVRSTLANYPDIRLQVCPIPNRTINLSRFLDTTDYKSVSWSAVTPNSPIPSSDQGGIPSGDLTNGIHIYTYSIANTCYPVAKTRKIYLLPIAHQLIGNHVDTVAVCKDFAEGINLRQILGIAANGNWTYDNNIKPFVNQVNTFPFDNALILSGDQAFSAPTLQNAAYKKPYKSDLNAIHLDFVYTTPLFPGSCLSNQQRRLVIVITSTIL